MLKEKLGRQIKAALWTEIFSKFVSFYSGVFLHNVEKKASRIYHCGCSYIVFVPFILNEWHVLKAQLTTHFSSMQVWIDKECIDIQAVWLGSVEARLGQWAPLKMVELLNHQGYSAVWNRKANNLGRLWDRFCQRRLLWGLWWYTAWSLQPHDFIGATRWLLFLKSLGDVITYMSGN